MASVPSKKKRITQSHGDHGWALILGTPYVGFAFDEAKTVQRRSCYAGAGRIRIRPMSSQKAIAMFKRLKPMPLRKAAL